MIDEVRFDGDDYNHERDYDRLVTQMEHVYNVMQDGQWRSIHELTAAIPSGIETSVSAQLRNLRKEKFGGYIVDRRRVNGLYEYKLDLEATAKKRQEKMN